ncbi:hypothetical protein [Streptomyces buecherae]|uniref:Uncharacterized protein n=1 Tax=Streptomyces buecherae TaxID=2763006 RepID=A0A7H8ND01_9ACTN|nr:hypothetical protein [Streptomyces buecherae]QKW52341.1 hypothetical protein HUT08_25540 [Streptomyces buecherae]
MRMVIGSGAANPVAGPTSRPADQPEAIDRPEPNSLPETSARTDTAATTAPVP